jgi:hypothetical protein
MFIMILKAWAMALEFALKHEADGVRLYETRAADGAVIRLDVFHDYARVQLAAGFVKRVASEAEGRAYADAEWGSDSPL